MSSSTPIATFAGIGSSFDAESLIQNLVTAEKSPETAMQTSQSNLQSQISKLATIASSIQSLGTAASALNTAQSIQSITATSGDSSKFTASAAASAQPGNYSIKVTSLAQAQTSESAGFATNDAGVAGSGTLSLSIGGKTPPYTVNYGSNDTLADIAASINSTSNGELNASVVFDGTSYHLLVSSANTGTANAVTFSDTGGQLNMATAQQATDASITVNGVSMTRSSNTISDAISGVTLNLTGTTPAGGAATSLNVGADTTALAQKLQTMVNAYNQVAQEVSSQLNYSGTTMGEDTLFGDSNIQGLEQAMGDLIANSYSAGGQAVSAGSIGLSLNTDGTISLDTDKLAQALTANPNAAQNFLMGGSSGTGGLTGAISNLVNQYTAYGTGSLVTEQATKKSQYDNYTKQIANVDERADTLEASLRTQFANLDSIMSSLSNQQQQLNMMFNTSSSSSSSSSG